MPSKRPNCAFMRQGQAFDGLQRALGTPEVQGAIIAARRQQAIVLRMPTQGSHLLLMSLEDLPHTHGPNVHQHHQLISRGAGEPLTAGTPGHLRHRVLVTKDGGDGFRSPWVPQLDLRVLGASGHQALGGMPSATLHIPTVPSKGSLLIARSQVPNLRVGIVRTGAELFARGGNRDVADGILVSLEGLEVVDVLVPKLDETQLIATHHHRLIRRPAHGLDSSVVRLHHIL
mmetsp:Transcript_16343/g.34138  ORF Transcript_16343/g.34138 Transcript_16343/m.34138 type:complete len:230 (+) Transcript_16343:704-1393(+)